MAGLYPFLRAFATVITRDVTTQTLIGDLYAGRSVMYADFVGYDEVAHHSGPERYDALDTLRRLDRDLGRLERAAANAPRPYRFVVLSDHGQSQGSTFEDRYGCSLGELVRAAMQEGAVTEIGSARVAGQESWGYAGAAAADVTSEDSRVGRALQRALRDRRETGPRRALPAAGTVPGEAVVLASGNLGLVYLTERPGRLSLEEIGERYPRLIPALIAHPGVGFILVRSDEDGPVVIARDGLQVLRTQTVVGSDPLEPFRVRRAGGRSCRRTRTRIAPTSWSIRCGIRRPRRWRRSSTWWGRTVGSAGSRLIPLSMPDPACPPQSARSGARTNCTRCSAVGWPASATRPSRPPAGRWNKPLSGAGGRACSRVHEGVSRTRAAQAISSPVATA